MGEKKTKTWHGFSAKECMIQKLYLFVMCVTFFSEGVKSVVNKMFSLFSWCFFIEMFCVFFFPRTIGVISYCCLFS